jgi:hypothetical protein
MFPCWLLMVALQNVPSLAEHASSHVAQIMQVLNMFAVRPACVFPGGLDSPSNSRSASVSCFVHVLCLQDSIINKLQLLNYEREFCKRK